MDKNKRVYSDPQTELYCGDAREVLAALPAESVQCCITSPPYWGLRDYKISPQVWGGQADCAHEWGSLILNPMKKSGPHGPASILGIGTKTAEHEVRINSNQGQFCAKCGAWQGSLGLEPSPELYVQHIVEVFQAVKRVLRSDSTCWVNLGDSYWGGKGSSSGIWLPSRDIGRKTFQTPYSCTGEPGETRPQDGHHPILKPLDLCGIPWRVAFALQADGWFLRSDIIWAKPNPMPESVSGSRWERHRVKVGEKQAKQDTHPGSDSLPEGRHGLGTPIWEDCPGCPVCTPNDGLVLRRGAWRPTTAHEYVFMLAKSDNYFADGEAVREPQKVESLLRATRGWNGNEQRDYIKGQQNHLSRYFNKDKEEAMNLSGRNKRSVWEIATQPFAGSHFATFPEKLVDPCLLAGTSERGACPKCGTAWVRVIETSYIQHRKPGEWVKRGTNPDGYDRSPGMFSQGVATRNDETLGFRPACACGETEAIPCLVLDCFAGSGTVGVVARRHGRKFIGIELSEAYCKLAAERLTGAQPALVKGGENLATR